MRAGRQAAQAPEQLHELQEVEADCDVATRKEASDMTDNRMTELTAIVEVLEKLAAAISWTMPTDARSVRNHLSEAHETIDRLKGALDEQK